MNIGLFASLILFKPAFQLSWEIWFNLNQEFVEEELCENKEKEELNCHGKCYLKKQLAKAEPKNESPEQNQEPVRPPHIKDGPFILMCSPIQGECKTVSQKNVGWSNLLVDKINDYHPDIFHPPQLLS